MRVQRPNTMDSHKLVQASRLVGATSWAAIASGVFIALAMQILLLLLGIAIGLSVGDEDVAGGFALWAIIVQLASIAVGSALAASLSHAETRRGGMAAGVMTWAVALALGGALSGLAVVRSIEGGAWSAFVGALLGLVVAMLGGAYGATLGRRGTHATPMSPEHTEVYGTP